MILIFVLLLTILFYLDWTYGLRETSQVNLFPFLLLISPIRILRIVKNPALPSSEGEIVLPDTPQSVQQWDEAISSASKVFSHRMHNIFCNNCHHHVAQCLNNVVPGNKYGQVGLAWRVLTKGHFVSFDFHHLRVSYYSYPRTLYYLSRSCYLCRKRAALKTWLPICMVLLIIVVVVLAIKLA